MKKIIYNLILLLILLSTGNQNAKEILIYADNIRYDSKKNIVANGGAKVIFKNEIITSDLIIYDSEEKKFIMPKQFTYKDSKNNYYSGTSGYFLENLKNGEIEEAKILLNDGTRIAGKKVYRRDSIDIIKKAVYTQCESKINIKNFKCPIWQLEGETFLHDNENLFLYQKHTKLRLFNIPVFYLPYLVTPSPLRKDRKSGFLSPNLSFNFIDTTTSQNASFPYYFNIDLDKELTLTPILRYGGGVDSSQRFLIDYNQLLSGGNLNFDISMDTKIENENNETWFSNGSIITNYKKNINEKYKIDIESALQTSRTYIRETEENNQIVNNSSLSSKLNLYRYGLLKEDDKLHFNISTYQVVKKDQDNSSTPTVLPYINYNYRNFINENIEYENNFLTYNIVRDKNTTEHAKEQQKFAINTNLNFVHYALNSKINFKTEIHNQYYKTRDKLIEGNSISSNNYRFFPMSGIFLESPMKHKNKDILITPKISLIINEGISNKQGISNEDSTNQSVNLNSQSELNRFSGTDILDDSKRILLGISFNNKYINTNLTQSYEMDPDNEYNKEIGNNKHLSDTFIETNISYKNTNLTHALRYNSELENIKTQNINLINNTKYGIIDIKYLDEKENSKSVLTSGKEYIEITYNTKKIKKYSQINFNTKYDLMDDKADEYKIGYEYFDECFGLSVDFKRSLYEDENLKPEDSLTIMFSFKNLGAYKSTNLAVSEIDKQDIGWENVQVENEKFN